MRESVAKLPSYLRVTHHPVHLTKERTRESFSSLRVEECRLPKYPLIETLAGPQKSESSHENLQETRRNMQRKCTRYVLPALFELSAVFQWDGHRPAPPLPQNSWSDQCLSGSWWWKMHGSMNLLVEISSILVNTICILPVITRHDQHTAHWLRY